jgi:phosphatidylserine/phosphatidylglycerophosphate/cardiolipin synthase-like enzyme
MDVQAGGYSGSESYKYVEPILYDRGGELLVVSPYIGMGYAKRLVALGKRKKVRVVTSRYSQQVCEYIQHHSRHLLYGYIKAFAILAMAAFVAAYFSLYLIAGIAVAGMALVSLVALLMYSLSRSSNIEVRVSYDRFVHEKAYISGGAAAVGSANLTYNGMHKNVERVEVITDPERVARLRTHFFDLWKSSR